MHPSALNLGKRFFEVYCSADNKVTIVDLGSKNVNGSLRAVSPKNASYIGADFDSGEGVDVVLEDPYKLPFGDESVDVVVCSSVFEHSEFFWIVFLEVLRILKPSGIFYLNVPSNGYIHRYPVDCWRFYPDSGHALASWGRYNGYKVELLESFIADKVYVDIESDAWNDFVGIFIKDPIFKNSYPKRIIRSIDSYTNGFCDDSNTELNSRIFTDDFVIIKEREEQLLKLQQLSAEQQNLISERERQLETMLRSKSWKITLPLRFFGSQLQRLLISGKR